MGYRQYLPLTLGKPIFYVSLNGSDVDGDGTFNNPWRTISKGVSHLSGWDTLYIRGGTYVEQVTITRSGTADAPITIAAYPGEKVVVDGQAGVAGLNEGLPNNGELLIPSASRFGTGFRYIPLVSIEANYIIFEGIDVTRSMGRGIRVWRNGKNTRGVTIRNCNVSYSRNTGVLIEARCKEIIIENCDISRNSNFAPYPRTSSELDWAGGCVIKGSDNVIVRATSIHENWGEGLITDSQTNNSTNITISDCVFYDNMRPSVYLHGVNNVVVDKNLIYHSSNPEFPFGEGIAITPSEPQYEEDVDIEDIIVANNIIVGMGTNVALYGPDGRHLRRIHILYNTLINAQNYGIMESGSHYEACELINNLCYQSNNQATVNGGADFSGWSITHNAWYPQPPASVLSGHDVISDPQLENPQAERVRRQVDPAWYKIKPTSPVMGQGSTALAIGQDFFNNDRDAQPDIGAHELQKEVIKADPLNPSFDGRSKLLSNVETIVEALGAEGFKRFLIISNNIGAKEDNVLAYGIQFPDRQCLIYGGKQANTPRIFSHVRRAFEEYDEQNAVLRWMD